MITFEHQGIATAQYLNHVLGRVTCIGQYAQPDLPIACDILHRLAGIMRNRIRPQFKVAYRETIAVPAKMQPDTAAILVRRLKRAVTKPNGNLVTAGELED